MDSAGAASHGDEGNPVAELQSQILELGRRHDQVMSTLANRSNVATRSYIYIPRERQIVPFSGDYPCCLISLPVSSLPVWPWPCC